MMVKATKVPLSLYDLEVQAVKKSLSAVCDFNVASRLVVSGRGLVQTRRQGGKRGGVEMLATPGVEVSLKLS